MLTKNRLWLFVVGGLLVSVFIAWQVMLALSFRVVSITPDPKKAVASSTENFKLSFNKELDATVDYKEQVSGNSSVVDSIEVRKSDILVDIKLLESEKQYSFTIKNIRAKNGQSLPEVTVSFRLEYIPFNELSDEEKKQQLEQTDVGAIEDPLDQFLPHSALGYYLTGGFPGNSGEQQYALHARITLSKADVNTGREAAIEAQKQNIKEFLRSKNLDPANYPITYEIVDPPS